MPSLAHPRRARRSEAARVAISDFIAGTESPRLARRSAASIAVGVRDGVSRIARRPRSTRARSRTSACASSTDRPCSAWMSGSRAYPGRIRCATHGQTARRPVPRSCAPDRRDPPRCYPRRRRCAGMGPVAGRLARRGRRSARLPCELETRRQRLPGTDASLNRSSRRKGRSSSSLVVADTPLESTSDRPRPAPVGAGRSRVSPRTRPRSAGRGWPTQADRHALACQPDAGPTSLRSGRSRRVPGAVLASIDRPALGLPADRPLVAARGRARRRARRSGRSTQRPSDRTRVAARGREPATARRVRASAAAGRALQARGRGPRRRGPCPGARGRSAGEARSAASSSGALVVERGREPRIDRDEVGLLAGLQRADDVAEPERPGAVERAQPQPVERRRAAARCSTPATRSAFCA